LIAQIVKNILKEFDGLNFAPLWPNFSFEKEILNLN
jgi:hypothetical protein